MSHYFSPSNKNLKVKLDTLFFYILHNNCPIKSCSSWDICYHITFQNCRLPVILVPFSPNKFAHQSYFVNTILKMT